MRTQLLAKQNVANRGQDSVKVLLLLATMHQHSELDASLQCAGLAALLEPRTGFKLPGSLADLRLYKSSNLGSQKTYVNPNQEDLEIRELEIWEGTVKIWEGAEKMQEGTHPTPFAYDSSSSRPSSWFRVERSGIMERKGSGHQIL